MVEELEPGEEPTPNKSVSYLHSDEQARLDKLGIARPVPTVDTEPNPKLDGRLCYPNYNKNDTRVVSYPALEMTEWNALQKTLETYGRNSVVEKLHTSARWAWRVRAPAYRMDMTLPAGRR